MDLDKYLLVISRFCEIETYLYDSIELLLNDWNVSSIEQLIAKTRRFTRYTVFKVSKIWSDIYD